MRGMHARHADDSRLEDDALRLYTDVPMPDGDAVLLLDDDVCLQLEGFVRRWDEQTRNGLTELVSEATRQVLVAIARRNEELLPSDYQLWRELHAALRDRDVHLLPIRALPAA